MNVLVWGTGSSSSIFCVDEDFLARGINIRAFVDNNEERWGKDYFCKKIISPAEIKNYDFQYIVVASLAFKEISRTLIELGVKKENILSYSYERENSLSKFGEKKYVVHKKYSIGSNLNLESSQELFEIKEKIVGNLEPLRSIEEQYPLVERVVKAFKLMKAQTNSLPAEYKIGENWDSYLKSTRETFYTLAEKSDIKALTPLFNNFCRNHLSEGILGGQPGYENFKNTNHTREFFLHNFRVWMYSINKSPDISELKMPPVGNPYGYSIDGNLVNINCFWQHYRATYSNFLLKDIQRPVIAEIGGGYGGLAYFFLKMPGEKVYIDFDIPENLIIAFYYLSMAFPEKRILFYDNEDIKSDEETFKNYDIILMPNFMLPALPDKSVDMFLNHISLSEMDFSTITEYHKQIERTCKKYFHSENLAHEPFAYKGFPVSVFPELPSFREIMSAISRWALFDMYSKIHTYKESLFVRTSSL